MSERVFTLVEATESFLASAQLDQLKAMAELQAVGIAMIKQGEYPAIGDELKHMDLAWYDDQPMEIETPEDAREEMMSLLLKAEADYRQCSPSEVWVNIVNERDDASEAMEVIDSAFSSIFAAQAQRHVENLMLQHGIESNEAPEPKE